jgi:ABC-type branched-subunit amino acid transport system substrate-binding protein
MLCCGLQIELITIPSNYKTRIETVQFNFFFIISILPDTLIEIVPINSNGDLSKSFQGALSLGKNKSVVAIIGDDNDSSTQTIGLISAANNMLHCTSTTASPLLSDKQSYPLTFRYYLFSKEMYFNVSLIRTQTIGTYQSKAIVGLVKKFNIKAVAIMGSKDEIGFNYVKSIQTVAQSKGVDASFAVTYDPNSALSIEDAFKSIIFSGLKIIILDIFGVASEVLSVARRLNMLQGDFWIICTIGFDERLAAFNLQPNETDAFTGIWQVERPTPYDIEAEGVTDVAKEFRKWYRDLYNLDSPMPYTKGVAKGYNTKMITLASPYRMPSLPNNCKNSSELKIAQTMPPIEFNLQLENMQVPFRVQGDHCVGNEGSYLGGYLAAYYAKTNIDSGAPDTWMTGVYQCTDMLISTFDYYSRTGQLSIEEIQQRKIPVKFPDVSKLVNNAQIPSILGGKYILDANGDLNMDLSIKIYFRNKSASYFQPLNSVIVGKWSYASDEVTIFDESKIFFNGNATAPPKPISPLAIPTFPYDVNGRLRIILVVITSFCTILCIALVGYTIWNQEELEIKASSPLFLVFILIGAIVSFIGIMILSIYPMVLLYSILISS